MSTPTLAEFGRVLPVSAAFTDRAVPWATACGATEQFWSAMPRWVDGTGRTLLGRRLLVWTDRATVSLPIAKSALASLIDGTVSLGELVEDLLDVTGLDGEAARLLVAVTALQLAVAGALDGVPLVSPPEGTGIDADDPTEGSLGDERGPADVVVLKVLPDGRRVVSATVTVGGSNDGGGGPSMAAQHLAGNRSIAELIPRDSCVGSKLRNFDDVDVVSVRCADGRVRSVRCHDADVSEGLRALAGERGLADEQGPIEAFVTAPLEGSGPLRVYDGRAERRGRPRAAPEAVAIVDQLIGEQVTLNSGATVESSVPLRYRLVAGDDRGLLVPGGALGKPRAVRTLRSAGWEPSVGRAELHLDGSVSAPAALTTARRFSLDQILVLFPGGSGGSLVEVFTALVDLDWAASVADRQPLLDRLADFIRGAQVADLDEVWSLLVGGAAR